MKIYLKYYSGQNFGDDLFVKIFSDYFKNEKIYLIGNPFYFPKDISNLKTPFISYVITVISFLETRIKKKIIKNKLRVVSKSIIDYLSKKHIFIVIGGSIFMDKEMDGANEIDFSLSSEQSRLYDIKSEINKSGSIFVVGANLGPTSNEKYFDNIKNEFKNYKHIVLRDYSSYNQVKDLSNVQYAPDIAFALNEQLKPNINHTDSLLISVVDPNRFIKNCEGYYNTIKEVISHYLDLNFEINLVSFCDREGDDIAISQLINCFNSNRISEFHYNGNITEICDLFASAKYIICNRFHSMIMSMVYNKPMFPIIYNCKMKNYLLDVNYKGEFADIKDVGVKFKKNDIVDSFNKGINYDCLKHKKYSKNQFLAIEKYINQNLN